ncbi:MAG TPA: succinate dehydrogenase cytochrome b subunit, partial [Gemmataceae bacterium]|nr:succinate dehydrogenase cytochrome b subunit [Gemmataceae bacterium]
MATATTPSKRLYPTNAQPVPMSRWLFAGLGTTVGSKYVVALTGLLLTGFVIAHMTGNLLIFRGREALNSYALFLKERGALLWAARIGLLIIFVLHVWLAMRLTLRNRAARPTRYAYEDTVQASIASRTMIWTGLVILAFVIFHLMHYTFGLVAATAPNGENYLHLEESLRRASPQDPAQRHDVYAMTIYGFRNIPVAIAYIVAQLFLGLHLSHGISSTFQSMGWSAPRWWRLIRGVGLAIALAVVIGNIAMPLAVM